MTEDEKIRLAANSLAGLAEAWDTDIYSLMDCFVGVEVSEEDVSKIKEYLCSL